MTVETKPIELRDLRQQAGQHAAASALVPGLGQLLQHRFAAAGAQFGTVVAYVIGAVAVGGHRALLLALLWNVWSVIDAYRHEAD